MRPNVLLVVLDTARADAFEPYGAGEGATPTLGQLARRGTALPHAIAPSNWTMPSHASVFAGALPRSIGLAGPPGGNPVNCRPRLEAIRDRLLPEVLRRAGYDTRGVSCNAWISARSGFDIGFDRFVEKKTPRQAKLHEPGARARLRWALESARARFDDGAEGTRGVLRSWMEEPRDRPFFWFVNLVECHSPYLPPRPYNDLTLRARLRAGEEARRHLTLGELWRVCLTSHDIPFDTLARMRHLYGRSIRLMDDWLGSLFEEMDRRDLLDDTLVIVTSDHGENFGEGGLMGHSFSLDQRLIWVPLIVAGPVRFVAEDLVSLPSLPRRISDAIGLEDHPWTDGAGDGVALSQYDGPAGRDEPRVTRVASDWSLDEDALARLTEPATAATDGIWKLVRYGRHERVFDLRADPMEARPVDPATASAAVAHLRRAIDAADADVRNLPAGQMPRAEPPPSDEETAELEERLRELGYL